MSKSDIEPSRYDNATQNNPMRSTSLDLTMPPRRRPSAPENRIYKSSAPEHQVKFPNKIKRIKSYGKRTTIRAPKQETLTQMDFVNMHLHLDEDDEDSGIYEDEVEKPRKRRRTMNDKPKESPNYHTQTITQLDWTFKSAPGEGDAIYDVPSSPRICKRRLGRITGVPTPDEPAEETLSIGALDCSVAAPQTPHRSLAHEIPWSQSPVTPPSLQASGLKRSPLKQRSTNIPIPFTINSKAHSTPQELPNLKIEDTFEDSAYIRQQNCTPSTPSKPHASPAKSVRFAIPDEIREASEVPGSRKKASFQLPVLKVEILDSEAESDEDDGLELQEKDFPSEIEDQDDILPPDTCYGEFGAETQIESERILTSPYGSGDMDKTQPGDEDLGETQNKETQATVIQRLSTQQVDSMAPRTPNSDIFISIHPQHVTNIVNRTKDHEFRSWPIPPQVTRLWIYETSPVSTLRYMAAISTIKKPGEILDERGVGNAAFNKGSSVHRFAYEILALYELADPLPLATLKMNEWLRAAPQRHAWVRPAVLDHLMANLKRSVYGPSLSSLDDPSPSASDAQEAEAQLFSTMLQFTQIDSATIPAVEPVAPSPIIKESTLEQSTQDVIAQVPLSQASTVDLSQSQTPRHLSAVGLIWESPTRPVSSSFPTNLETPRTRVDSSVQFSIPSSQLLTRSQMLPHSLIDESVPGPPLFIQDSDEEELD